MQLSNLLAVAALVLQVRGAVLDPASAGGMQARSPEVVEDDAAQLADRSIFGSIFGPDSESDLEDDKHCDTKRDPLAARDDATGTCSGKDKCKFKGQNPRTCNDGVCNSQCGMDSCTGLIWCD
ncbi:Uu.00g017730.m01.CDS01 [Anthostomella pinea]|uniref:Uu.00g017730.m01.CDS01 n=1 Tax=Anthostomella pinea TaxID=933095 RepID=A0AAI8YQH9_9PEZI|nr:Uu.00g017730.m01.CDS01 [Anthostomella pinea]